MERAKKPSAIPVSPIAPAPQVVISEDNSRVKASLPSGEEVEVLLFGATVISWKSANGTENLFLSDKAHLDGSKPARGGIPVVFPAFGPPKSDHATGQLPQHGFARSSRWEYLGKSTSESSKQATSSGDSSVKLDFGLSDSMLAEPKKWPYQFGLTYSVTLSTDELETSLVVRNTGSTNYDFQVLFHTYLAVDDITKVAVHGLESSTFVDKTKPATSSASSPTNQPITFTAETDRIYSVSPQQVVTVFAEGTDQPRFRVERDMLSDVVVWNPWDAKAKTMADLGPADAWRRFVGVEAGSVSRWNSLDAGDSWEGGQRIRTTGGG